VLVVAAAVPPVVSFSKPENVSSNLATIVAGALGVAYFVQKQRLEEIELFEKLFTGFNKRYGEMNDHLERIRQINTEPFSEYDLKVLNGYFNLCAEEFLFYSQGQILSVVWQSWCRGMRIYLANEEISRRWEMEEGGDSLYGLRRGNSLYGLTFEAINQGAGVTIRG